MTRLTRDAQLDNLRIEAASSRLNIASEPHGTPSAVAFYAARIPVPSLEGDIGILWVCQVGGDRWDPAVQPIAVMKLKRNENAIASTPV
jgi:hypothetical protein